MSDQQNPQTQPQPPQTFEQALARLEQIVSQLEDGRLDLASALAGYEEGVKLFRHCHAQLERFERRVELLTGVDAQGRPITEPFDDQSDLSLEEKAQTRSKRRSTKKSAPSGGEECGESGTPAGGVDEPGTLF